MANTYLVTSYKDKDAVKALGAHWDSEVRRWFIPDGRELTPFLRWLPSNSTQTIIPQVSTSTDLASSPTDAKNLVVPKRGITLSCLLGGISLAVANAYKSGVWTLVEVVEIRIRGGHVYLGVSERDERGAVLAKTSAVIWQSTANIILREFEHATGVQLASGIKLLVRARPVF